MEEKKTTELSDTEIDQIAEAAEDADLGKMKEIQETVQVDENAELEPATVITDGDEIDVIAKQVEDADVSLFDLDNDEEFKKKSELKLVNNAKSTMDISDEDAYDFIKLIDEFKKNQAINVYERLPEKLKKFINQMMLESKIAVSNREAVSRMVLQEFMSNADVEAAFVDFEKALNEALNIPSIVDMYSEHTRNVMEKSIPEMIENIKDEHPEKAEMLAKVKDAFTRSYTFEDMKKLYEENNSARKAVRRHYHRMKSCLDNVNRINANSKFRMNDARLLPKTLEEVLVIDLNKFLFTVETDGSRHCFHYDTGVEVSEVAQRLIEMRITAEDAEKFATLFALSCEGLNGDDPADAAYMYYSMKNIIMLKHTQEAKTEFAAELINNICDVIALIRIKEAEFYEANPHLDKSKSSKKSNSARNRRK